MRDTNTFGWRMRWERERLGIGQKELAEMMQRQFGINIGQSGISKIENDQTQTPPFPVQIALSKILNCSLNYLITGEEWKESTDHFATDEANRIGAMVDRMTARTRRHVVSVAKIWLEADQGQQRLDNDLIRILNSVWNYLTEEDRRHIGDLGIHRMNFHPNNHNSGA